MRDKVSDVRVWLAGARTHNHFGNGDRDVIRMMMVDEGLPDISDSAGLRSYLEGKGIGEGQIIRLLGRFRQWRLRQRKKR